MPPLDITASSPGNGIRAVAINLARHSDRWAWVANNFRNADVEITRIDAIDATDPGATAFIERVTLPGSGLSRAEAACILSHRKAWQTLVDSTDDYLAVFEDDVHVSADMRQLLDRRLLRPGMDLVKLEIPTGKVSYAHRASATLLGRKLHRLISKAYSAGGYIVSRRCALRLLDLSERCSQPVDVILFDDTSPIWSEFGVLQVVPAACVQDIVLSARNRRAGLFASAIEEQRQHAKTERKAIAKQKKKSVPLKKLRHYLSCVLRGAHPLRHKVHVALDLGFPGKSGT